MSDNGVSLGSETHNMTAHFSEDWAQQRSHVSNLYMDFTVPVPLLVRRCSVTLFNSAILFQSRLHDIHLKIVGIQPMLGKPRRIWTRTN